MPTLTPAREDDADKVDADKLDGKLDPERIAILLDLYKQLTNGTPFSEEETIILNHFVSDFPVTELEADVTISRAMYNRYISHAPLSREQQNLFEQYTAFASQRIQDIADIKALGVARRLEEARNNPREPQVAPANDTCAGAVVIPGAGPFPILSGLTADITDATVTSDPPTPSCQSNVSRSVWYTFQPTTSASYTISSCADAPTGSTVDDTVVAVYTSAGGCAGPFTQVTGGCDDDTCTTEGLQSVLTLALTGGTQYYLVVWQFDQPAPTVGNTAVQLRISQLVAPANDTCAGAIPLTLNIPVQGTMNSATVNNYQLAAASPCYTAGGAVGNTANILAGRDVVYTFTAPASGSYSFRVWLWSGATNPGIYLATTCPAPGAPPQTVTCTAAANRNTSTTAGAEEITCQALTTGQQVFFFVDELAVSATTVTFNVEVLPCVLEAEANGTPATANTFQCGIQGSVNPAADVDFYSLGTPATGARVFAQVDAAPANNNDFDLRVTTTTDTLEYDDLGNVNIFGSNGPNIAGARATGVTTFLRLNHFTASVVAEPYRIYSVVQPPGAGMFGSSALNEAEPNGSLATATAAPANYFYGTVTAATDADVYVFSATAGDTIFLSLDGDPSRVTGTPSSSSILDGQLFLLDSAGTQILGVDDVGNTTSTVTGAGSLTATTPFAPSEALVFHARTTGLYYAVVQAFTGTGDYLLSISKNCAVGGGLTPQISIADLSMNEGNGGGFTNFVVTLSLDHPSAQSVMVNYATAPGSATAPGDYTTTTGTATFAPGALTTTVTIPVVADITNEPDENFVVNLTMPVNATILDNQATVTIVNDDNCTITCPANVTQSNDANQCGAVVTYAAPSTTGVCGTITCSPASGSFFPVGTTTVTCTSAAGPSCMFTVTINDTQAPSITCPANITQGNDPNQCGAVINYAAPTVSDNCPGVTAAVCTPASGSFFPKGTTTVNCSTSDAVGNTANCSFTVTINDTQAPSITCPPNIVASATTEQGTTLGAIVNYPAPTVSDNCPGVGAPTCSPVSGSFFPVGINMVSCSVTDASGNSSSCQFSIIVTTAFTSCFVDDGTGNSLSLVTDTTSPLYGIWQLRINMTGQILQGHAEFISNVPGHSLIAYDHDNRTLTMDLNVNYGSNTATASVSNLTNGAKYVLRDRNITNNPPCS